LLELLPGADPKAARLEGLQEQPNHLAAAMAMNFNPRNRPRRFNSHDHFVRRFFSHSTEPEAPEFGVRREMRPRCLFVVHRFIGDGMERVNAFTTSGLFVVHRFIGAGMEPMNGFTTSGSKQLANNVPGAWPPERQGGDGTPAGRC